MDLTAVESRLQSNLAILYGPQAGDAVYPRLMSLLERRTRRRQPASRPEALTQRDAILITYGDQFQEPGVAPLQTLEAFCKTRLSHLVSGVHILPFFPSSSDDGFSVFDYRKVDPALGSWDDIHRLAPDGVLYYDDSINVPITRKDGTTQATYKGYPLYYWARDKKRGSWWTRHPGGSRKGTTLPRTFFTRHCGRSWDHM